MGTLRRAKERAGHRARGRVAVTIAATLTAAAGMASVTVATGAASAAGATTASAASGATHATVVVAEKPATSPNYIFPYMTTAYFSTANLGGFQYLMYRPLYWFGGHASVSVNERLSLAALPRFSDHDQVVTISLKPYRWSNGEAVDATDVLFWMNIWKMRPSSYAGWFPGGLSMPTSVKSVHVTSPSTITVTFDRSMNPHWLLYNELSQITPLPVAWTRTSKTSAPGSDGCARAAFGTDDAGCKAVYDFLSEQSGFNPSKPNETIDALGTYATNPLWKVEDGPWHLASFGPTQPVVFTPNRAYSGPNKPRIGKLVEEPFTSGTAEFDALASKSVDVGYLPTTDVTSDAKRPGAPGRDVVPGSNNARLSTFRLVTLDDWNINYIPYNFRSTGDGGEAGPIFSQLYVRQAIQHLVDQPLYVRQIQKGYAYPDYGPVPTLPKNADSSRQELVNPYPYSVPAAVHLLASHGWKVVPGGVSVCEEPGAGPGRCGKGITKGAKLSFTLQYVSGVKYLSTLMTAEASSWAEAGIHVVVRPASTDTVYGTGVPCPKGCKWELENGIGWTFSPDIYPSGEELFASGAGSNEGSFETAKNDALVRSTTVGSQSLTAYENHLEKVLPVIWEPQPITTYEVRKGLLGVTPLDPLLTLTPATYHWS